MGSACKDLKLAMPERQIFLDPQRKRWRRLRRIFDVAVVIATLVVVTFIFNLVRNQEVRNCCCPRRSTITGLSLTGQY